VGWSAAVGVTQAAADGAQFGLVEAAARFQRPDGSYRFRNRFRYVIAENSLSAVA